jgi:hypothetical protein
MEDSSASSFQLKRREKREQLLHSLLSDIRAGFEGLQGGMQGLVDPADKLHSVDRAVALGKRYQQLEWEAKLLGLDPLPAPEVPPDLSGRSSDLRRLPLRLLLPRLARRPWPRLRERHRRCPRRRIPAGSGESQARRVVG